MKHYIIIIHYIESSEKIGEIRPRHSQFLETAYAQNIALFSGRQASGKGGIIAAKGESIDKIRNFFKDDPYQKEHAAEYQFIEFEPGHYQKFLEDWVKL